MLFLFAIISSVVYSQNVNNGKIQKDSTSLYTIKCIEDRDGYYIIHALKDEYHFRIKSLKNNEINLNNTVQIVEGGIYQLDIRDYKNSEKRIFYSTNFGDMGECTPYSNREEFLCGYNPSSETQYSQILNLKDLCLIKELKR